MSTWRGVSRKLRWVMAAGALVIAVVIGVSVVPNFGCEETAEAGQTPLAIEREKRLAKSKARAESFREEWDRREREREERWRRFEEESERRREEALAVEAKAPPPRKRGRRVRRWAWMSPPEKIAKTWNVPQGETREATITGVLRICTSEQEGSEEDCIGIYQVLTNIRSRSCNRDYFNLITECDDDGETLLSVMRRASRYVVGAVPARYARQRWISEMTTSCDMPRSYPVTVKRHCRRNLQECAQGFWEKRHRHHCEATTKLVTGLVDGTEKRRITNARIIAWGGRCEVPRGACDDPVACSRGLARVPHIERMKARDMGGKRPANAFWCRRGTQSCGTGVDPVCLAMGYGDEKQGVPARGEVREPGGAERVEEKQARPEDGPVSMRLREKQSDSRGELAGGEG